MMVEAEATEHTVALVAAGAPKPDRGDRRQRPGGREAGDPRAVPGAVRAGGRRREAGRSSSRSSWTTATTSSTRSSPQSAAARSPRRCSIAGKADREEALDLIKEKAYEQLGADFEGREKEIGAAFRSVTKNEVRARVLRDADPHRRSRAARHPAADRRGAGAAAGARVGVVRAWRDPDPRASPR